MIRLMGLMVGFLALALTMPDAALADGKKKDKTTGSSGEEIHTDEYGRVKTQLPFDRADEAKKGKAEKRIPSHIRHRDRAVTDEDEDGNPDRPVITGTVPNPEDDDDEDGKRHRKNKRN